MSAGRENIRESSRNWAAVVRILSMSLLKSLEDRSFIQLINQRIKQNMKSSPQNHRSKNYENRCLAGFKCLFLAENGMMEKQQVQKYPGRICFLKAGGRKISLVSTKRSRDFQIDKNRSIKNGSTPERRCWPDKKHTVFWGTGMARISFPGRIAWAWQIFNPAGMNLKITVKLKET